MTKLLQVTPFLFVQDLDGVVRFFQTGLAFRFLVRYDDFAYLQRDNAGIRLLQREDAAAPAHAYFDVEAVDELWAEFHSRLTTELRNNPDGPRDQTYGQREFTVFGPEGITLFFGQDIFRDAPAWQRAAHESDSVQT